MIRFITEADTVALLTEVVLMRIPLEKREDCPVVVWVPFRFAQGAGCMALKVVAFGLVDVHFTIAEIPDLTYASPELLQTIVAYIACCDTGADLIQVGQAVTASKAVAVE